jgi:hypothetical protein
MELQKLTGAQRGEIIDRLATLLVERTDRIMEENRKDLSEAKKSWRQIEEEEKTRKRREGRKEGDEGWKEILGLGALTR